ncbi:alternate-type signal peptide domain-containing protein [uncultured Demequina sp.]|uniref:alternate-type signal peptide domain-containing protein n=1 Tax=uncultured Demequina sp. TaxID=693499 RepID=UPI0025D14746|nr:alternate-type signal peptide domain-containing protein [uncultured Demequina sp.]
MNKMTKASIATGAGVILLMGGAASLAYWNDSELLSSGGTTITAGQLDVVPVAASAAWESALTSGAATDADFSALTGSVADFRIVPGNTLRYTETFDVTAVGDDLYFTVEASSSAIAGPLAAALSSGALVSDVDVTGSDVALHDDTGALDVYSVTANGGNAAEIEVSWTIAWPFGSAPADNVSGDNAYDNLTATLPADGALTVTQVLP